eukprot:scaffold35764_cov101-Isochrysis_galbana.AAC.1
MQAGAAGGGGVPHRGEVDKAFHGEGAFPASKRKRAAPAPPSSTALPPAQHPTGSLHSPGGSLHTPDAADGFEGGSVHTLDAVHGFEGGSVGHATYTSSWIAPRSDVHSQQRWFYMGQAGEGRLLPPPAQYIVLFVCTRRGVWAGESALVSRSLCIYRNMQCSFIFSDRRRAVCICRPRRAVLYSRGTSPAGYPFVFRARSILGPYVPIPNWGPSACKPLPPAPTLCRGGHSPTPPPLWFYIPHPPPRRR